MRTKHDTFTLPSLTKKRKLFIIIPLFSLADNSGIQFKSRLQQGTPVNTLQSLMKNTKMVVDLHLDCLLVNIEIKGKAGVYVVGWANFIVT